MKECGPMTNKANNNDSRTFLRHRLISVWHKAAGMSPIFPQELCDVIIDYLHDDKLALIACSTVCKNWLPSCRFHLYSTIHLPFIYPHQSSRSTWPLIDAITGPRSSGTRSSVRWLTLDGRHVEVMGMNLILERLRDFDALERLDLIIINWQYVRLNRRAMENLCALPTANNLRCLTLSRTIVRFETWPIFLDVVLTTQFVYS
jgi:hypothetical protein